MSAEFTLCFIFNFSLYVFLNDRICYFCFTDFHLKFSNKFCSFLLNFNIYADLIILKIFCIAIDN